jgi:hypothetical protein
MSVLLLFCSREEKRTKQFSGRDCLEIVGSYVLPLAALFLMQAAAREPEFTD